MDHTKPDRLFQKFFSLLRGEPLPLPKIAEEYKISIKRQSCGDGKCLLILPSLHKECLICTTLYII